MGEVKVAQMLGDINVVVEVSYYFCSSFCTVKTHPGRTITILSCIRMLKINHCFAIKNIHQLKNYEEYISIQNY